MKKEEIEKIISESLEWSKIYDKFELGNLSVIDRYAISYFIACLGKELNKKGLKVKYHQGVAYDLIKKDIERRKTSKR